MRHRKVIVLLVAALLLVGGCDKPKRQFVRLPAPSTSASAELATASVAGAVCNVLRDLYETGSEAEITVARRCWFAALEAAGLVPPAEEDRGRLAAMTLDELIEFLTVERKERGWSLRQVAEASAADGEAPVGYASVWAYEHRDRAPTAQGLIAWAAAFGYRLGFRLDRQTGPVTAAADGALNKQTREP